MSTLIKFNPQMLECHLLYKRKATRRERKGLLTERRDEKEANATRDLTKAGKFQHSPMSCLLDGVHTLARRVTIWAM
jgi:hypothetical protein